MLKYWPFVFLFAATGTHAFEVQPGNWLFPHTISWTNVSSGQPGSVEGEENECISPEAAKNYPLNQAKQLEEHSSCRIKNLQNQGNRASFDTECKDSMNFKLEYEKLADDRIRVVQTVANPQGKGYIIQGVMQRQSADLSLCE